MFKSWRKLEDLRDNCDTYAKSFHKVKLHFTKALQYHEKLEELIITRGIKEKSI